MLKEISIENSIEENQRIFDSIEIGEKFYILTTNKKGYSLYKYLCVKTKRNDKRKNFIHKNPLISCINITCCMCDESKCLGGKPIKIK